MIFSQLKKMGEKSLTVLTEDAKNEIMGPSGPPLCTLVLSYNINVTAIIIV